MAARHREASSVIAALPNEVFAFVDDPAQFSSHMGESSMMMGGGGMSVEVDAGKGQAVGSHIRLSGRVFGMRLFLDEVVTRREPPFEKIWQTVGTPRLLVIGTYTLGVQVTPDKDGSRLRVFIDYDLPMGWATYWLGYVFGGLY